MKKQMALIVFVLLSVFLIFGSSFAWQGRMAGMGDPYGLTPDDSDFLIHPALITRGEGFDVFSHFNLFLVHIHSLVDSFNRFSLSSKICRSSDESC